MSAERIVAVLGRPEEPTDAVEEYCLWLGDALAPHGFKLETHRVSWVRKGWRDAKAELREKAADWRNCWALMQYTALSWSQRGFAFQAPRVLRMIRQRGARCGVVFHDAIPYTGSRPIDRLRRLCQVRIMRQLCEFAELIILTTPAEKLSWLPSQPAHAVFIPVGANLPSSNNGSSAKGHNLSDPPTVAVYCLSSGPSAATETQDIAVAVNRAAARVPRLRLLVFGRNALELQDAIARAVDSSRVSLETRGILPAADVLTALSHADVMLFVRGAVSNRRGSAIAGIASGLPLVAYTGLETAAPITEAGVQLVPLGDCEALGVALEKILTDDALRRSLAERSRRAQERYFSWPAIAACYATALRETRHGHE
jgi:glycosyltransferase involved in cell wall biosynthesis